MKIYLFMLSVLFVYKVLAAGEYLTAEECKSRTSISLANADRVGDVCLNSLPIEDLGGIGNTFIKKFPPIALDNISADRLPQLLNEADKMATFLSQNPETRCERILSLVLFNPVVFGIISRECIYGLRAEAFNNLDGARLSQLQKDSVISLTYQKTIGVSKEAWQDFTEDQYAYFPDIKMNIMDENLKRHALTHYAEFHICRNIATVADKLTGKKKGLFKTHCAYLLGMVKKPSPFAGWAIGLMISIPILTILIVVTVILKRRKRLATDTENTGDDIVSGEIEKSDDEVKDMSGETVDYDQNYTLECKSEYEAYDHNVGHDNESFDENYNSGNYESEDCNNGYY